MSGLKTGRAALVALVLVAGGPTLQVAAQAAPGGVIDVDETGADEEAKAYFRVGKSLYDSGRFSEAAAEWRKAYELSKRSELLYNIYVAHRDASEMPQATDALRSYLAEAEVEPARRVNLEARLRALEEAAEAAPPEAEAGATTEPVEPAEPGVEPAPEPAQDVALDVSNADENVASEILPVALIGLGGSMVVAGIVTGVMTNSKVSEIEDECTLGDGNRCPEGFGLASRQDDVDTLALVTDVLLFGGGALAVVGAVLMIMQGDDQPPAAQPAPTATLGCGPRGCMASVRGRF